MSSPKVSKAFSPARPSPNPRSTMPSRAATRSCASSRRTRSNRALMPGAIFTIVIPAKAGPLHKCRIMILLARGLVGGSHAAREQAGELRRSIGGGRRQPAAGGDRGTGRLGGGRAAVETGLRRSDGASVVSGGEPVQGGAAGGVVRAGRPGTGGGFGRPAVVPPLRRAGARPAGSGPLDLVALSRPTAPAWLGGDRRRGDHPTVGREGAGDKGRDSGRCDAGCGGRRRAAQAEGRRALDRRSGRRQIGRAHV